MDSGVTPASDLRSRQFSLRGLFVLTSLIAVALSIAFLCRGSQYVGAFASPWTAISFLPVLGLLAVNRWQLATPRRLTIASAICYLAALVLPALQFENEIAFGAIIWLQSFWGTPLLFGDREIRSGGFPIGPFSIPLIIPIACALGAAANTAYLAAIASRFFARNRPRLGRFSRRAATLAPALAVIVLIPLCWTGDIVALLPGYGLWLTAMLALALAARH